MIYHLSQTKRFDKNGKPEDSGGVPKYGMYLQKAIGCEIVTPEDRIKPKEGDVIIADGYFAGGWDTSKYRVISICHGLWKEFSIRNNKVSDFQGEVNRQHAVWTNPKIKKVSVSKSADKYLFKHHGVKSDRVILNGVDTNLFKPIEHRNEKPVVIYAANDYNKSSEGRLGNIAELLKDRFEFRYLNAKIGEEQDKFAQGDIYIQGSRFEGNSYASLESLACGLPIVASRTGLFEDTEFNPAVGMIVDWDAKAEEFAYAIQQVWWNKNLYKPREWVEQNASFEIFKKQWQDYIKEIING